jgi:hypothetical protein
LAKSTTEMALVIVHPFLHMFFLIKNMKESVSPHCYEKLREGVELLKTVNFSTLKSHEDVM